MIKSPPAGLVTVVMRDSRRRADEGEKVVQRKKKKGEKPFFEAQRNPVAAQTHNGVRHESKRREE